MEKAGASVSNHGPYFQEEETLTVLEVLTAPQEQHVELLPV